MMIISFKFLKNSDTLMSQWDVPTEQLQEAREGQCANCNS